MMKKILFEDALILRTVKTLRALVKILPLRVSLGIARAGGTLVYFFSKRGRLAYKNLRAAFASEKTPAEMKGIARRSIQNLAMSAVELLRFPDMDKTYIEKNIRILGTEKINAKLKEGKGAIFLTAHFGCWEMLNLASNLVGYPMVALVRSQKHPRSDEFLNSLRTSKGNQVIRKGMPVREILKALRAGKIVGMLSDQDGGKNGSFVQFLGRMSSSPSGVATFALRTHAPIFPVFIFREDLTRHRVEVEGPLSRPEEALGTAAAERDILQQFARILESKIRKAPDQWLWAHRRWKSTPNRSVIILSDGKAGHLNQSLAVLEALREERAAKGAAPEHTRSKVVEVRFKNTFFKIFLSIVCHLFQGHISLKSRMLRWVLEQDCYDTLIRNYADIVISCGSSLLGINLLLKAENQAKSVAVMRPSFSAGQFDVVIVPKHDKMKSGKNIFVTETSLSRVTEKVLENESKKLSESLEFGNGKRKIGLLMGGDTDTMKFSKESLEKLLTEMKRYSGDTGVAVLATSSRRTPAWADELLKASLKDDQCCPLLVIANEANRSGIVPGILGLSDALVVSGESMSMVSEAVASGKPVIVFMPSKSAKLKPKHGEFLNRMMRERLIVCTEPQDIYQAIREQMDSEHGRSRAASKNDREVLREAVRRVA